MGPELDTLHRLLAAGRRKGLVSGLKVEGIRVVVPTSHLSGRLLSPGLQLPYL